MKKKLLVLAVICITLLPVFAFASDDLSNQFNDAQRNGNINKMLDIAKQMNDPDLVKKVEDTKEVKIVISDTDDYQP